MRFGGKKSGPRRTAKQIRDEAVAKERERSRQPGRSIKLPKVDLKREMSCCLDKDRPLPEVFRVCPDCPKLTEAGSLLGEVVALTDVGSRTTEVGSKKARRSK